MKRRDLFKGLISAGLAALLPKVAAVEAPTCPRRDTLLVTGVDRIRNGWPRTQLTQELLDDNQIYWETMEARLDRMRSEMAAAGAGYLEEMAMRTEQIIKLGAM